MSQGVMIALVVGIVLMTAGGYIVSIRRNQRVIDELDRDETDELKVCLTEWQVAPATKRLSKLGWVLSGQTKQDEGRTLAHFTKQDGIDSLPLSKVLSSLNRAGYLSLSKIEPKFED